MLLRSGSTEVKEESKGEEKKNEKKSPEEVLGPRYHRSLTLFAFRQEAEEKLSVTELMDQEFGKIIGHDNIKSQLRAFHKQASACPLSRLPGAVALRRLSDLLRLRCTQVQLDEIRAPSKGADP